jgi:outer membrane protein assembly factor BamA
VRPILLFLFLFGLEAHAADTVVAQYFPQYENIPVKKLEIHGLLRSRESIVRWMLGTHEGEPFHAQAWQDGVEHLYKTESVYDIHTSISQAEDGIEISLTLEDKWTLFPYFDFQGGGGSVSFSAGVFDTNIFGTFTNVYAGGGYLDGEYSYEFGASQKWFLQSTFSVAGDVAKVALPVTLQNQKGDTLANFTWARAREAFTIGRQTNEFFYWELPIEAFKDSLKISDSRTRGFVFDGVKQWRITPTLHFGKVAHSDYLEQGHELTLSAFDANPFNSERDYHGAQVAWKQVIFLPDTRNLAYYVSFSHMTAAPVAYQYRLGGFDSVRGFAMNRIFGLDSARANFEYRATLFTWKLPVFELGRMVMQGALFTDAGDSWHSANIDANGRTTQTATRFLYSAGAGFRAFFLHFANALVRLDVAKAVEPNEGFNVAFGVGQFF